MWQDGAVAAVSAAPVPWIGRPRLLAPQSGSRATSTRPTLRWLLPAGLTRARVELCADRACGRTLQQPEVTGQTWRAAARARAGGGVLARARARRERRGGVDERDLGVRRGAARPRRRHQLRDGEGLQRRRRRMPGIRCSTRPSDPHGGCSSASRSVRYCARCRRILDFARGASSLGLAEPSRCLRRRPYGAGSGRPRWPVQHPGARLAGEQRPAPSRRTLAPARRAERRSGLRLYASTFSSNSAVTAGTPRRATSPKSNPLLHRRHQRLDRGSIVARLLVRLTVQSLGGVRRQRPFDRPMLIVLTPSRSTSRPAALA